MKFYEFGNIEAPVLLLLPGTCCHWRRNFGHVIDLLKADFHIVCVCQPEKWAQEVRRCVYGTDKGA